MAPLHTKHTRKTNGSVQRGKKCLFMMCLHDSLTWFEERSDLFGPLPSPPLDLPLAKQSRIKLNTMYGGHQKQPEEIEGGIEWQVLAHPSIPL